MQFIILLARLTILPESLVLKIIEKIIDYCVANLMEDSWISDMVPINGKNNTR